WSVAYPAVSSRRCWPSRRPERSRCWSRKSGRPPPWTSPRKPRCIRLSPRNSLILPEKFKINGRVPCKAIQELPARKDCAILSSPKPQVERSKFEDNQYGQKPADGIAETGGGYSRNPIRVSRVPFRTELSGELVTSFIDRVAQPASPGRD